MFLLIVLSASCLKVCLLPTIYHTSSSCWQSRLLDTPATVFSVVTWQSRMERASVLIPAVLYVRRKWTLVRLKVNLCGRYAVDLLLNSFAIFAASLKRYHFVQISFPFLGLHWWSPSLLHRWSDEPEKLDEVHQLRPPPGRAKPGTSAAGLLFVLPSDARDYRRRRVKGVVWRGL